MEIEKTIEKYLDKKIDIEEFKEFLTSIIMDLQMVSKKRDSIF